MTLHSELLSDRRPEADVLALDGLLETLQGLDPRKREVVEMKFFAGLSEAKIAEALQVDVKTVERDWKFARAFLAKELQSERNPP